MGHIVADSVLLERLTGLVEPVEIRDAGGAVIGHFAPTLSPEMAERYAEAAKLFDLDEAGHRLRTEKGRRTTAEVLARQHPFTQEDLDKAEQALAEGGGLPLTEVWKRIKGEAAK